MISAPAIPTTYMIHPTSDSSSKADVMITAVRTYLDMSIRKSETFSQTEIFFTISLDITKINKKSFDAKVCNDGKEVVVFPKNNRRFFFFLFILHVNMYPIRKEACNG